MKPIWDDFIKREELETEPGVVNEDAVRELDLNTYLAHIKDMVEMGMNQYSEAVSEHLEDVMSDIYSCTVHALEGRYPEPDENSAHLRKPENVKALQNLTYLCVHATEENWPDIEKELRDMAGREEYGAGVKGKEKRKSDRLQPGGCSLFCWNLPFIDRPLPLPFLAGASSRQFSGGHDIIYRFSVR